MTDRNEKNLTWERVIGEPAKWYRRLVQYYEQTPPRSLLAVYNGERKARGMGPAKSIPGEWHKYIKAWDWKERAELYDQYIADQMIEASRKRREEQLLTEGEISAAIGKAALKMGENHFDVRSVEKTSEDGSRVSQTVKGAQSEEMRKMAEAYQRLGRQATGIPLPDEGSVNIHTHSVNENSSKIEIDADLMRELMRREEQTAEDQKAQWQKENPEQVEAEERAVNPDYETDDPADDDKPGDNGTG